MKSTSCFLGETVQQNLEQLTNIKETFSLNNDVCAREGVVWLALGRKSAVEKQVFSHAEISACSRWSSTANRRRYLPLTRKDGKVCDSWSRRYSIHEDTHGLTLLRYKAGTKREFWSTAVNRHKSSWIAGWTIYWCWNTNAGPLPVDK